MPVELIQDGDDSISSVTLLWWHCWTND